MPDDDSKTCVDLKGHDVHFIHPDASADALKMMAENNIGSLVVLEDGKLVGLIRTIRAGDCFKGQDVTRNSGPGHYVD